MSGQKPPQLVNTKSATQILPVSSWLFTSRELRSMSVNSGTELMTGRSALLEQAASKSMLKIARFIVALSSGGPACHDKRHDKHRHSKCDYCCEQKVYKITPPMKI